jgi:hypothetical protein
MVSSLGGACHHALERICAYIEDAGGICGQPCRAGSSYCAAHHALCHIAGGSASECLKLRETEALARAVGGRRGRPGRRPPDRFLRRLELTAQVFLRQDSSRFVPKDAR